MFRYFFCMMFLVTQLVAQTPRKPLPRNVNLPSKDQVAPVLSGDGQTLLYMSTYSESGELEVKITTRQRSGTWSDPEDVDVLNRWSNNNMVGGYFLSYDGNTIVFSTRKSPGIGKFDIWMTEKKGSVWSAPVNLGKPLNSVSHEGAPSLSPDGQLLYFMRCEQMDLATSVNCKIMVAERRGKYWNEPEELPSYINTGNATFPRILGDNKTLIFSSDRPGGKGKMDFYLSRYENGNWQEPVAMDYLNTPEDDQFVSIPLKGDVAYYSMMYRGNFALIMAQIPEEMQPRKVIFIDGTVTSGGEPVEAFLQLYDFDQKEPIQYGRNSANGSFKMILPEGKNYDFSATPTNSDFLYFAKIYELEEMESSKWEKAKIELVTAQKGYSWANTNLQFVDGSADIKSTSDYELKRLIKLLKNNAELNLTLEVYTDEVIEDTIKSNPDLTEIRQDTIEYEVDSIVVDTVYLEPDTLISYDDTLEIDEPDTLMAEDIEGFGEIIEFELDSTIYNVIRKRVIDVYHNDRTPRQAETLKEYFRNKGVPEDRIIILGLGDINNIVDNSTEENRRKNRRVDVLFE